ncbi:MAG TPA: hypothetical protein VE130_00200 [Nitrososphaeraceae archaeon]|jgi:hypothetical protein|nr:hypothetical protein [Nitrososphaeraceae archaeon]
MCAFTSQEISKRLSDFDILMRYMPFLQEHGFSEFGKGQLTGKIELLKEGLSDSALNHSDQQPNSRISSSQLDPRHHEYEEQSVNISRTLSINPPTTLDDSKSKRLDFNYGEGAVEHHTRNAMDQSKGRKYLTENNKWNFKADDDSSWITRIRKLADV